MRKSPGRSSSSTASAVTGRRRPRPGIASICSARTSPRRRWPSNGRKSSTGSTPARCRPRSSRGPMPSKRRRSSTWVNEQLREVELAAKNAGGRIPMRRLNRDEYANTVRDLLQLDELIVRPLIEELPGDGKAEGFDRLGVALFFDQTQIERSLARGGEDRGAGHRHRTAQDESTRRTFDFLRLQPAAGHGRSVSRLHAHDSARAKDRIVHPDAHRAHPGGPTYRREYDGWGVIEHFAIGQVVTQDGYYRVRIKAKVDNRGAHRAEQVSPAIRHGLADPGRAGGGARSVGHDRGGAVSPRPGQRRGERSAGLSTAVEPHREGGHPRAELQEALLAMDRPARQDGASGHAARPQAEMDALKKATRRA